MARKVFFSFHYARDAWRVSQVRNSNVVTAKYERTKFLDAAAWQQIEKQGEKAIQNWIDSQLVGTSITIVLIGNQTSTRQWVNYEIEKSWDRGNALIGIYIHNLKDQFGKTDTRGVNPFQKFAFSNYVKLYDWIVDDGRANIDRWIELAIVQGGR